MFLTSRFYFAMMAVIAVIAMGFAVGWLFVAGRVLLVLLVLAVVADALLLWFSGRLEAWRRLPERFSNGDENEVSIRVESGYAFPVGLEVIDEVPFVFQRRDVCFRALLRSRGETTITYRLRPTERGTYGFGRVRLFATSPLGLVQRRQTCGEPQEVKVYPSFLMLRQYELLAMSNNLTEMGIKRIRRIGHNTDFEQIREYVAGDDYRTINWRATARRSRLMVNVYQEERSQQVYCVIDKGRMMQQAFAPASQSSLFASQSSLSASPSLSVSQETMTLLDYSINAALVLSFVAVNKQDRAGLLTFSSQLETFVAASRNGGHMQKLQEALYAEKPVFGETDYSALLAGLSRHVSHRALIVLFTSFTSMPALRRQLSYLRQIATRHRLLVVFFEDEEMKELGVRSEELGVRSLELGVRSEELGVRSLELGVRSEELGVVSSSSRKKSTEEYYQGVIMEKFLYDQRLIAQTLRQYGIQSLLTTPRHLSVDVINKYLEIKARL